MGIVETILLLAVALLGGNLWWTKRKQSNAEKELVKRTFEYEAKERATRVFDAEKASEEAKRDKDEAVSNFRRMFDALTKRRR